MAVALGGKGIAFVNKTITTADPEFEEVLRELALNREAIRRRRELSEASFRQWLYEQINDIAHKLGYAIQDIAEFVKDMAYSFKQGYAAGRDAARRRSIRSRDGGA